jgi:hypothetical protein
MMSDTPPAIAARLMSEFAKRTGLSSSAENPKRYLWTDAFAVCNFLELFQRTGDQQYRHCATKLIDQVHRVLGRYRDDDLRRGWISGLDDERRRYQPTVGGLRIGKPLSERGADEAINERLEWDRDGQYFHYLTKWVHMPFVRRTLAPATTNMSGGRVSWQKQLSELLSADPNPVRSVVSTGR